MTEAMRHRGPDSDGYVITPNAALGVRRLRVIDLSTGDQPIYNEGRDVAVVSNGEIYNYARLTEELSGLSHRFATKSDAEPLVHGYEEWGVGCLDRLKGMFAFAILDDRSYSMDRESGRNTQSRQELFLARDRLGIKPLYYYQDDGLFLFASEVRALLASGLVPRRLSLDGLYSFLAFGSLQEPLTLVEGVYSVPPAHHMTVDVESAKTDLKRYWEFPVPPANGTIDGNALESAQELREVLRQSVSHRLVSDVPLGAFLSGGIDSGAVVSLMSLALGADVRALTVAFREAEFNEAPIARLTARGLPVEHTEVCVTGQQVLEALPDALAAMDQPTVDGINTYFVSAASRKAGLTVALSGLGGDELFAGYSTFASVPRMELLNTLLDIVPVGPRGVARAVHTLAALRPRSDYRRKLGAFLRRDVPFDHPYFLARALFVPSDAKALLDQGVRERLSEDTLWHRRVEATLERSRAYDPINAVSYLECSHYLVNTLLRDTDQMSMAHSLEVRVPLIDHELVETMMRLSGKAKARRSKNVHKPLLVESLGHRLPEQVTSRGKSTFTFPWERWLRQGLRSEVEEEVRRPAEVLGGVLDQEAVWSVWRQFLAGQTSWSRPWSLFVLSRWAGKHLG